MFLNVIFRDSFTHFPSFFKSDFRKNISKIRYFQGESDIEQLAIVLQHLGTPTEESWPGHKDLPDYHKITFPESSPTPWSELLPGVEPDAVHLVKSFIMYDDNKRISAKEVGILIFKMKKKLLNVVVCLYIRGC